MCIVPISKVAARAPIASKIDVAVATHIVELKLAHGLDVVVQATVGVPGAPEALAMGMQESNDGWEGIVMVYNVGKVGHCLVAFVCRSAQDRASIVDSVYCILPAEVCQSRHGWK